MDFVGVVDIVTISKVFQLPAFSLEGSIDCVYMVSMDAYLRKDVSGLASLVHGLHAHAYTCTHTHTHSTNSGIILSR